MSDKISCTTLDHHALEKQTSPINNGMRQDYFTRFAEQLFVLHSQDADSTNWSDVGDWLADAPKYAPDEAMTVWTELMCSAIAHGTNESENDPQLVASLGGYLDRLLTFAGGDFAAITVLPAFESLMRWTKPSSEGLHPSIEELIKSGWSPVPLMRHIDSNRDTVLEANRTIKQYSVPMDDTGAGGFYKLIQQVISREQWVPDFNTAYGLLFEDYFLSDMVNIEDDSRFIRNVLRAAPAALDKGLAFAYRQVYLTETHLNAFFPMVMDTVDPKYLLDSLVALIVDEPDKVKGKTMPLLNKHHPELAQLVSIHCSLFPDATSGATYAELLVEPYLRMLGLKSAAMHETVNPLVFDDTDCAT